MAKLKNFAMNFVFKKPEILWTDFGNYLATSLQYYYTIIDDYEMEIQKEIIEVIKRNNRES
jgi:hypothetical protein